MPSSCDVIVLGEDAAALTAAALFAAADLKVRVYAPYGLSDPLTDNLAWQPSVPAAVWRALSLHRYGYGAEGAGAVVTLGPDGPPVATYERLAASVESLERVSPLDAAVWPDFVRDMRRHGARLATLRDILSTETNGRRSGAADGDARVFEAAQFAVKSAVEVVSDYFQSKEVRQHAALPALLQGGGGPYAYGAASPLALWHGEEAWPARRTPGGPSLRDALADAAAVGGAVFDFESRVKDIIWRDKKARGVVLLNEDEIRAKAVVASVPGQTLGLAARLKLSGDAAPLLREKEPSGAGVFFLSEGFGKAEQAADDAAMGQPPKAPMIAFMPETDVDGAVRALSLRVQNHPFLMGEGKAARRWRKDEVDALGARLIEQTGRLMPELGALIAGAETALHPGAVEGDPARAGLTETLRALGAGKAADKERFALLSAGDDIAAAAQTTLSVMRTVFRKGAR